MSKKVVLKDRVVLRSVLEPKTRKQYREILVKQTFFEKSLHILVMNLILIYVLAKKRIVKLFNMGSDINFKYFDGLEKPGLVRRHAQSFRALDILYNYQFGKDGKLSDFWFRSANAIGVKNRFKLVKHILGEKIEELINIGRSSVTILSVASGSGQAILETTVYFKNRINIKIVLLDIDKEALEYSFNLASTLGLANNVLLLQKSTRNLVDICNSLNLRPDIVEIVGFLDYRPLERAATLLKQAFAVLNKGGIVVASNILYNPEMFFLTHVVDWKIIHRTPRKFMKIWEMAGITDVKLIFEPNRVYILGIGEKKDL